MKILIEGEDYNTSDIKDIIDSRFYKENGTKSIIDYVGYYYSFKNREVVYILPKVFIDEKKKVLFEYDKFDLINPEFEENIKDKVKLNQFKYLLILFYKSLIEYKNRYYSTDLLSETDSLLLNSNIGKNEYSYIDIVLNIINFHKKNKNTILFIEKQHKSQQHRKTSWQKTINKTLPFIDKNNDPIYIKSYNKKKYADTEETLLTIFYSVLNHLKQEYKFNINIDNIYTIYTGKSFEKLILNAPKILKKIKYKYFSDTLIKIYKLMELYFNVDINASTSKKNEEFLMVNKYNIIFEDMIDKLFSDNLDNQDLSKLKNQQDGKIVDHLFEYDSLLSNDESIFYIGDSKYYKIKDKDNNITDKKSIYKQFTYAKNVIQFNIDLLNDRKTINNKIRYRDEITEGYNISPNFFIEGRIYEDMNYDKAEILPNGKINSTYHFPERLFDRDTLFVHHYNINFLFVLKSYTIFNSFKIETFRKECKDKFRENFISYLSKEYMFFEQDFDTDSNLKDFTDKNFRMLNGKMYRTNNSLKLIVACKNPTGISVLSSFNEFKLI
ncbi:hypothetical protein [Aliarcobacter cryaerophilus]|uniref:hypothetical protein n=1 Tax=Aliarcobacter cryaerophilus TaxID=28198 RepID=UPI0021B36630|nr:hypothetical protein [Aliarcobacter cryaerophilus]MCT7513462.1 hypothetical protein [Aliarcobacter cryaerophilus]